MSHDLGSTSLILLRVLLSYSFFSSLLAFVLLFFSSGGVVVIDAQTPLGSAHPFECWGTVPSGRPSNSTAFIQLALGNQHMCGLTVANTVQCWGQNDAGQRNIDAPGLEFAWITAGSSVSCGLFLPNRTARCYGSNLNNRTIVPTHAPLAALAMRQDFGCAMEPNGAITCWGNNAYNQVSASPGGSGFTQLAVGADHACALVSATGVTQCWGSADKGQTTPPAGVTFKALCSGASFSCGLDVSTGFPRCWGFSDFYSGTPNTTGFATIACGSSHVCGVKIYDGSTQCWGSVLSGNARNPPARHIYAQLYAANDYSCGFYAPEASAPPASPMATVPALPGVSPLAANASASFGESEPTVDLSAPTASSSVAVRSSLQLVQVGNTTVPDAMWVASNATSGNSGVGRRYEAQLGADTNATQVFAFSANSSAASFSGLEFVIAPGSVKWSLNFTSNVDAAKGITLRYRLSDLSNSSATGPAGQLAVVRRSDNTPRANMTSYYLAVPSSSTSAGAVVMVVEVFDVALVDDAAFEPIAHAVDVVRGSNGDHYELVLAFPAFNRSLFYDPSIGLGVLLGSGGGGDDVGLIVGVVVAVGVAAVVVVAVIVAGVAIAVWRKRRDLHSGMVNFNVRADDSQL
ncbi:uncharacterized protein ACA1_367650 [Acanthamoeba castellanii str. Neff]|uniref:non-specific serine/threonine protein kinase n=1 Tax=Acanthamoeba castellanii (strain ATCC 30010 / Neff) TaxID=1257118 RepID=L8GYP7_ACACF|nr:uncharacterized protein ACA1_367650 [Acanthamoeba castellanii str. Neff]ELR18085.1 hypothetical protein ACA1_367650 [Acanthamoeba castellanii str. Neff]